MINELYKSAHILHRTGEALSPVSDFRVELAEQVRAYHRSFPEYSVTPLCRLDGLAERLGLAGVYVKDESKRFGLNAFKVLGGSYAIGCAIGEKLGLDPSRLSFDVLMSDETRRRLGDVTFVTATDGNHGRGVAWTAARLGQRSVVYMPKGTAKERLDNIRALGSDASITALCYDDAVRLAAENAEKYGWTLIQDTAWPGYETVPRRIMQGYTTMALEAVEQLSDVKPTHIFLQAGVGSLAAAVTAFFAALYGEERPVITVVEPDTADCFYKTAFAADGSLHAAEGEMHTIMAGLACGEPSPLAWDILRDHADHFVSMPDYAAAEGMRLLAHPCGNDEPIVSGESGASALGLVCELMRDERLRELRDSIGLNDSSRVLCFSTEGATDRENYRRIVSDGASPRL